MSNFNFYLNRQGVRGKQGEKGDKGDQGFSPYIEIKANTPSEFIMTVNNENDSFDTPNLIPTAIGDKVMEMDVTLTTHTEDIANLKLEDQRLNATVKGIQGSLGTVDASIEAVNQRIDNQSYRIGDLEVELNNLSGEVASNSADITTIKSDINNKQNKLVEGENITLTNNADGTTTISSTGGGGGTGDVTAAGNNTFTGKNEFKQDVIVSCPESLSNDGGLIINNAKYPDTFKATLSVNSVNGALSIRNEGNNTINITSGFATYINGGDSNINVHHSGITFTSTAPLRYYNNDGSYNYVPIPSQNNFISGDNITLDKNTTTGDITISAITSGGVSPLDEFIEGSTNDNTTTITAKNGKALKFEAPTIAVGNNLVNTTDPEQMQLFLKQGDVEAGENVIVEKTATGIRVSSSGGTIPDNVVTTNTTQTISGNKTFTGNNSFSKATKFLSESDTLTFDDSVNSYLFPTGASITKGKDTISRQRNFDTIYIDIDGTEATTVYRNDLTINSSGDIVLAANNNTITGNVLSSNGFGKIKDKDGNVLLSQGNVTAGDNVTIEKTGNGIKISSAGGGGGEAPANMVTVNTVQTITADKTFNSTNGILVGNPAGARTRLTSNSLGLLYGGSNTLTLEAGSTSKISAPKLNFSTTTSSGDFTFSTYGSSNSTLQFKKDFLQFTKSDGTVIDLLSNAGGGSGDTSDEYGIRADYAIRHGIIDNPNGIITYSAANKDIVVNQGLVLNCAGNGTAKTTIATAIPHTVTSTGAFTLFYANGNLLECGKVDYSTVEPEDNGVDNYQAWFNPDKTANPNQQWQFKSNDTGNIFRHVNSATPIADFVAGETGITSVSYLGYRVTDDDVFAQKQDVSSLASPDISRKIVLDNTVATNTIFTAPTDGIFTAQVTNASRETYVSLRNGTNSLGNNSYAPMNYHPTISVSAKKGDSVTLTYGSGATLEFIIFIPLFGAE